MPEHPIIRKIFSAAPGTYVIFFVYDCPYCQLALDLLKEKRVPFKGYDIRQIRGGITTLLYVLNQNAELLNFDPTYRTKPLIFLNGKFLGGYSELYQSFRELHEDKNY